MAEPFLQDSDVMVYVGDALATLRELEDECVDCVVTSPPYWNLRDYGAEGQLGLEDSPQEFVENMVSVFTEVRRVLAPHGTLWLNLGDTYAANRTYQVVHTRYTEVGNTKGSRVPDGLKPKDLVGAPWRVALALQEAGWWLRSDIVWSKPDAMPSSVTDRPTSSHEYVFLLAKRERYYFDGYAIREPAKWERWGDQTSPKYGDRPGLKGHSIAPKTKEELNLEARREAGRNSRDVWSIVTQNYSGAHFATFPEELVRRCILAGCPERVCRTCGKPSERIVEKTGGTTGQSWHDHNEDLGRGQRSDERAAANGWERDYSVKDLGWTDCGHDDWRPGIVLDPFLGSGTTALVARNHQRHAIGIELSEEYAREHIAQRLAQQSLFA